MCEPDEEERRLISKVAETILNRARSVIEEKKVDAEAVLGGSYAKDTWLKGECDIDLFVKLPPDLKMDEFKQIGLDLAKEILRGYKTIVRYAEHPYLEGFVDGVRVNIVPCFNVKPKHWISAADRSPYHTEYVKKHLKEELKGEVRLLKKFIKARGVYGAEVKTRGFSGYVCEVLILKYGSFLNTLEAFSDLKRGTVISLGEVPADVKLRFQTPIIILDPVDSERNLGAAISEESLATFITSARSFLQNPSLKYFESYCGESSIRLLEPMVDNLILILFTHERRSPDILWGQLHKTSEAIERQMKIRGFEVLKVFEASSEEAESAILLLLESQTLPKFLLKVGPEVYRKVDALRFVQKNLNRSTLIWFSKDGRILSLQERAERDAVDTLRNLLSNPAELGVAEGLRDALRSAATILTGREALEAVESRGWLRREVQRLAATKYIAFDPN
jgi:tRNA nucleotidyltransferase (CCA-adding enzyme)